jgi:hypothetical protein
VRFNIGYVQRLELILEFVFHKGADEYFFVSFVGVEALGVGEELMGKWEEPVLFYASGKLQRESLCSLFVGHFLADPDEVLYFSKQYLLRVRACLHAFSQLL